MISVLCILWLLYHIIVEQCQIGYASWQIKQEENQMKQEENQ